MNGVAGTLNKLTDLLADEQATRRQAQAALGRAALDPDP